MTKIVGVRFRETGKAYYFSPNNLELKKEDRVIVESARGREFGTVAFTETEVDDDAVAAPLRKVIRKTNEKDEEKLAANSEKAKEAYRVGIEKIKSRKLKMKLIDVEYAFDNSRLLFYFTADGRIDFRELVKDLAAEFRTRIELRQVGVRDETRMFGGIGICGRELCCCSYLHDFAPVSIKMAKEQNLSLNPSKISGNCGRLMCCLRNEQETYEYLHKKLPSKGDLAILEDGVTGEVIDVNVLRQSVRVLIEDGEDKEVREYPAQAIEIRRQPKKKKKRGKDKDKDREKGGNNREKLSAEEEKELKELEKEHE